MYRPSGNPLVHEITKLSKLRTVTLSGLKVPERNGKRYCFWCNETELVGRKDKKYCSPKCKNATWEWSAPQKDACARHFLVRQDYKCKGCAYDWKPLAQDLNGKYWTSYVELSEECSTRLYRLLKNRAPEERRLEVDHVLAISLGGASVDPENLQILCRTCHKSKTKSDAQERARRRKELTR